MINENNYQGTEIAIVGICGRFPAADSVKAFWENLKNGKECIQFFSEEELLANGIDQSDISNPNYVRAKAQMNEVEMFDASFFGYTPREAELTDPQHRLFLECAWEALENAGYNHEKYNGLIGVYAGAGLNNYYINHILNDKKQIALLGSYQTMISNLNDTLCTHASYKLNLKGPSLTVQTACSTSLVSVHMACQSLLLRECDMALAGGVKVVLPRNNGYMYSEGGITSLDGHCRAFDSESAGMVPGEGIGLVVLKRLEDALSDRDHIYSVIKGSAINNDGSLKIGFTAPSIDGQAKVIAEAQTLAEAEPETFTYIETHGTATQLGDPAEINALTQAFNTEKRNYCSIGSVKSNVGHLDTSAGIAGLIKTVLMLEHKKMVPSLHFKKPNTKIDFENSPFFVNTEYKDWLPNGKPRRAGVSSFGIGGTNAHVILEEAPEVNVSQSSRKYKLILLSAKTNSALQNATINFVEFIKDQLNENFADIAYTLQVGRKSFNHRQILICTNLNDAINSFNPIHEENVYTANIKEDSPSVIFMFSGQGSQYVKMGYDLYRTEPFFRQKVDECFNIISPLLSNDIKLTLFSEELNTKTINQTELAQPLLFVIEYSLAVLLMHWGIRPYAMIGHSIGEYVAACLSGVFTLGEALRLVVMRGKLMQGVAKGSMLSVALPESSIVGFINGEVSLAAINADDSCVLSGNHEAITKLANQFKEKEIAYRILETSHAFHSEMMEPILKNFEDEVKRVKMNTPQIPYISNITGKWITQEQVKDTSYWTKHLRETVRFHDGICELSGIDNAVFVEVGPGKVLSTLVRQVNKKDVKLKTFNLLRHPNENISDDFYLTTKIGQLWLQGIEIDWESYNSEEKLNRVPLPTYPFERQKYWIGESKKSKKAKKEVLSLENDISDWFNIPSWEQSIINEQESITTPQATQWLVFTGDNKYCWHIIGRLEEDNQKITNVLIGSGFSQINDSTYNVNPAIEEDYNKLFQILKATGSIPDKILHLWNLSDYNKKKLIDQIDNVQNNGLYSLLNIAKSIGYNTIDKNIELDVVTCNVHSITGEEELNPLKATLLAAVKIIPLEYLNIKCRNVDVNLLSQNNKSYESLTSQVCDEIRIGNQSDNIIGYRGNYRWVLKYKALRLESKTKSRTSYRKGGVYLITGGFGGIGLTIAKHLAKEYKAKLILIGQTPIPSRVDWDKYIETNGKEDPISTRILKVMEFEQDGSEIMLFSADVSDYEQMSQVIQKVEMEFGYINGVFHTAGLADYFGVIQKRSKEQTDEIIAPKVKGTLIIDLLVDNEDLDFFVCFSSIGDQIYHVKFGQVGYNAANEFSDAFSHYKKNGKTTVYKTINWTDWLEVGMTIEAVKGKRKDENDINFESLLLGAIKPSEGIEVLYRSLNSKAGQLIISKFDLQSLIEEKRIMFKNKLGGRGMQEPVANYQLKSRPELTTSYKSPDTKNERKLIEIFDAIFGYEQIGINDDFFELGGDSLKAINLLSKIHKEFNAKILLPEFFNNSTISKLARLIENSSTNMFHIIKKAEKKDYYLASSHQKRLFAIQLIDKYSTAYNLSYSLILHGTIDYVRLELAIKQIINKHETFRTSFAMIDNILMQRVEDDIDFSIELTGLKNKGVDDAIQQFIQPFNLSKAPLFRIKLCKVKEDKHILLMDIHHIISDGSSWGILMKDMKKAYLNEDIGKLRIQYKDYTIWEQSNVRAEIVKAQQQYWLEIFKGDIPVLNIPTDYPRPEIQSFEGSGCVFEFSEEKTQSLYALCERYNVTLYMLLLSLYNILLAKFSNTEDLIVGTITAGRDHEDIKDIIGMFVNTLAIRSNPASSKKFSNYLMEIKKSVLDAFENQQYPFDELVDKLNIEANLNRNPLFDALFTLQNYEREKMQIGEIEIENYQGKYEKSQFDISLVAYEISKKIVYAFGYRTKLFKVETIKRLGIHFDYIVKQIIEKPDRLLSEVEIITPEEHLQLVYKWNETDKDYPKDKTIYQLFQEQVEKAPDNIALVYEGQQLTYKELNEKSNQLARHIREQYQQRTNRTLSADTLIVLYLDRSLEMVIGILAVMKAGGAYVPIETSYPQKRIDYILEDAKVELILVQKHLCEDIRTQLPQDKVVHADLTEDIYNQEDKSNLPQFSKSTDLAYVIYTSGTNGKPKGVMVEHRAISSLVYNDYIQVSANDVFVFLSASTVDATTFEIWTPLLYGNKLMIAKDIKNLTSDIKKINEFLTLNKVSILWLTKTLFESLFHFDNNIFKNFNYLIIGGEALDKNIINKLTNSLSRPKNFFNGYGATESTTFTCTYNLSNPIESINVPIGTPINNRNIYILDQNNSPVPIGVIGELFIGGAGLARGYLNRPDLTKERFVPNPFATETDKTKGFIRLYKTGDLARWLPDGNIEFIGRNDDQVKIRGFRIELGEIEHALSQISGIKQSCVLCKERKVESGSNKYFVAYYVLDNKDDTLTQTSILNMLSQLFPEYMMPSVLVQVETFPLLNSGKIDKHALSDQEFSLYIDKYIAPTTEKEIEVCRIWQDVLGIEWVGITDIFYKIGGNSILAKQVSSRMSEELKYDVKASDVSKFGSISVLLSNIIPLQIAEENIKWEF